MLSDFLPHDQRQLAVRLQVEEPYTTCTPARSSLAGPTDVVLLVEAGFQSPPVRGHVLTVLGSAGSGALTIGRIAAGAIERLLDGQHVRIVGGPL